MVTKKPMVTAESLAKLVNRAGLIADDDLREVLGCTFSTTWRYRTRRVRPLRYIKCAGKIWYTPEALVEFFGTCDRGAQVAA